MNVSIGTKPERKGDWIQTYRGQQFWPIDPRIEEINIIDIAHHLSNQCRFTGAVNKFYSVAEHSVRVSWACELRWECTPWIALSGLLHDAAEAYLVDLEVIDDKDGKNKLVEFKNLAASI